MNFLAFITLLTLALSLKETGAENNSCEKAIKRWLFQINFGAKSLLLSQKKSPVKIVSQKCAIILHMPVLSPSK